jgi:simple sugar transport system ATP-binding protein
MASELAIISISHKLNEVKALSDRVSILRHGAVVFNGHTANHEPSELAALMTGHEVTLPRNEGSGLQGEPLLSVKQLRVRGDRGNFALDGLDLELRAGEVLGVAGVSGNGQREFADALAGLRPVESGEILFQGRNLANNTPRQIIDSGMGYVPEDRQTEGIVPSFSVKDNLILKDFASKQFSRLSYLSRKEIDRNAEQLKERFDIRCPSTSTATGSLSGGNIQKVILAREIARGPKALVAVYPTRGIDMGAQEFIHSQLLERRREGIGIILISEELEEVMNLSDRIAVIYKGRILKVLPAVEATRERLGILMAGLTDTDPPPAAGAPSIPAAGAAHE